MMPRYIPSTLVLIAALSLAPGRAATIYDNTSNDSLQTIFFSDGPYTEIGDSIQPGGFERLLTRATVQFYNGGDEGTFDVTLRFYLPGNPVGAQWGAGYTVAGVPAPAGGSFDVTFSDLALEFPGDDLIFTVAVGNAASTVALGLNLFDPPGAAGTSATQFLIIRDSQFAEIGAGTNSNLYLRLEAEGVSTSAIPEPATWLLTAGAFSLLFVVRRRTGEHRDSRRVRATARGATGHGDPRRIGQPPRGGVVRV